MALTNGTDADFEVTPNKGGALPLALPELPPYNVELVLQGGGTVGVDGLREQ